MPLNRLDLAGATTGRLDWSPRVRLLSACAVLRTSGALRLALVTAERHCPSLSDCAKRRREIRGRFGNPTLREEHARGKSRRRWFDSLKELRPRNVSPGSLEATPAPAV